MVGRYGGEEFIAFLPETDREATLLVAERLRTAVEQRKIAPVELSDEPVNLTISIGAACWPDVEAERETDLVQHADEALYRAKNEGRNRCVAAEPAENGDAEPSS